MENLFKLTARDAVSNLKKGEISPMELIDAAEERIRKTDDKINALPTLCFDRARKNARHILNIQKKIFHRGISMASLLQLKILLKLRVYARLGALLFMLNISPRTLII